MHALAEPAKELRFTRAAQARAFWLGAAVSAAAALTIFATSLERDENPRLPHPAWGALPLALSALSAREAVRLTRHAYLILSPLGIEIFPYIRPAAGMTLVAWQEIHSFEIDASATRLTLHYNAERSAGMHLSLRPIPRERRKLLAQALAGRLQPQTDRGGA